MSNPAFQQQITAAVSAHGQWKARLATAIKEGKSEFTPAVVRQDNQCPFGKWLYGEVDAASKTSPHYAKVKTLHAAFHENAAKVLDLAVSGKAAEATAAMAIGGDFAKASSQITVALGEWSRSLD
jgi:hypothetical protein